MVVKLLSLGIIRPREQHFYPFYISLFDFHQSNVKNLTFYINMLFFVTALASLSSLPFF